MLVGMRRLGALTSDCLPLCLAQTVLFLEVQLLYSNEIFETYVLQLRNFLVHLVFLLPIKYYNVLSKVCFNVIKHCHEALSSPAHLQGNLANVLCIFGQPGVLGIISIQLIEGWSIHQPSSGLALGLPVDLSCRSGPVLLEERTNFRRVLLLDSELTLQSLVDELILLTERTLVLIPLIIGELLWITHKSSPQSLLVLDLTKQATFDCIKALESLKEG